MNIGLTEEVNELYPKAQRFIEEVDALLKN